MVVVLVLVITAVEYGHFVDENKKYYFFTNINEKETILKTDAYKEMHINLCGV